MKGFTRHNMEKAVQGEHSLQPSGIGGFSYLGR